MIEIIQSPWPWYVGGPLISLTMFLLLWFGNRFGVSSNLQHICAIGGAKKLSSYFDCDWKSNVWNLVFVAGTIAGGFIAANYLMPDKSIALAEATIANLNTLGLDQAGKEFIPSSLFSWEALASPKGLIMILLGGFLVGFGTRYADGCTSGHAISGLSSLQVPSLIAVVGFFIGGLIMTWLILPYILTF